MTTLRSDKTPPYEVIVIGGGPAGVTAALRARELGAAVALVERARLGGTCTNDGCLPTRVLAHSARLAREASQLADLRLIDTPPQVDFARLMVHAQEMIYAVHEKKQLLHHLHDTGVQVFADAGSARFVDSHTVALADGRRLQGERFILCPGGHARRPAFLGAEYALTHSDVWGLRELPRAVAVVGAAATGCQLASIFAAFGAQVTLLEMAPRIVPAEDELVSEALEEALRGRGIAILTGIGGVSQIDRLEDGLQLRYADGETERTLDTAAVVLAVGWVGNVETLDLPAAGVAIDRGFVVVDEFFRTSAPHVFAAGDITGRMMLVQSATDEARAAAENAVLGPGQRRRHELVPHGGFTDPEYGSVGLTEAQARAAHDIVVATVPYAEIDRAVIDGRADGFCKLIVARDTHRLLGAHVVGEQAAEIVHVVAAGMASGMWVEQLAELEIAYPTYTAILGLAARRLVRELGVMPLTPEWRTLGKPHAEWERRED
jgi:pyruvate/2-oxoglutarate dehydrogenase complex dihydrolipoamide dehydrogenase (E3) component